MIIERDASSRKVLISKKRVLKYYPSFYGFLLHEFFRFIFSILNFNFYFKFYSIKERFLNEIKARKILEKFKIKTTKIIKILKVDKMIIEKRETAKNLSKLKKEERKKISSKIGKITRMLNDKNFYFIDNRAQNWLYNKEIIRTDLEMFTITKKYNEFFAYCDFLSFISSIDEESAKEFIKGYGKEFKKSKIWKILAKFYIEITDKIF